MTRRMSIVIAVSALAGLIVAVMLGEEAPTPHTRTSTAPPALDATDAMAKALRKAIEGGDSP
jgi:hypothetical protein